MRNLFVEDHEDTRNARILGELASREACAAALPRLRAVGLLPLAQGQKAG